MRGEGATGKRGSRSSPGPLTHCRGGGDLLRHNLQGVDHRDVAQPLSDGQGRVAILERGVGGGKKGGGEGERERENGASELTAPGASASSNARRGGGNHSFSPSHLNVSW